MILLGSRFCPSSVLTPWPGRQKGGHQKHQSASQCLQGKELFFSLTIQTNFSESGLSRPLHDMSTDQVASLQAFDILVAWVQGLPPEPMKMQRPKAGAPCPHVTWFCHQKKGAGMEA